MTYLFGKITLFTTLAIFGLVYSQSINDLDGPDLKKKLEDQLGDINQLNLTSPEVEKAQEMLNDKCKRNGGDDVVEKLKNSKEEVKACIENYLNMTQIQAELEEAKKTGSMDEVFAKYCKKYPEIKKCTDTQVELLKGCLDEKEKSAFEITLQTVEEVKEFLCFKDGDRMAMFVAEGGPDCLQEKQTEVQECVNVTLGARFPSDMSVENLPTFVFAEQDCNDFDVLGQCIVKELESCKTTTPANIMDAFFKFLKKNTPCKKLVKLKVEMGAKTNDATTNMGTLLSVALAIVLKIFIH